jgi:PAS domain S-box-containing protein
MKSLLQGNVILSVLFFGILIPPFCLGQYTLHCNDPHIDSLLNKADVYVISSPQNALECIDKASLLADSIGNIEDKINVLIAYGNYYSGKKIFDTSFVFLYKALQLANENNLLQIEAQTMNTLGYYYLEIKRYDQAFRFFEKTLNISKKLHNYNLIAQTYINYGKGHYETDSYQVALTDFFNAYALKNNISDPRTIMQIYRGLGTVYFYLKKDNWALYYFNKAVDLCKKNNYTRDLGSIYTLIAHLFQTNGDISKALEYNRKALDVRINVGFPEHIASSYLNLGNIFIQLNKPDSAQYYIVQGINLLLPSKDYNLKTYGYRQFLNLLIKEKKYKQAIEIAPLYYNANDSLLIINQRSEIDRIEINHKIGNFEKENNILRQQIEIQKLNLKNQDYFDFIIQLVVLGILLLTLFFIFQQERSKRSRLQLEALNKDLDKEIKERKQKEVMLQKSEQRYRFLTDQTLDVIIRMDRDFQYQYISPSIEKMFGYPVKNPEDLPSLNQMIQEDFLDEVWFQYLKMVKTKSPVTLVHKSIRKDGSEFWTESLMNPIFDKKTDKLKETITVIRDVTERMNFEEELQRSVDQNKLLLREIHHRVKNNFAILVSLMDFQERKSEGQSLEDVVFNLKGRIHTMALVHELLYRSNNISSINLEQYVIQLSEIVAKSFSISNVEIIKKMETCILDIEIALPIGLICNEIITNAYKYAFSKIDHPGILEIDLHKIPDAEKRIPHHEYYLRIRDNGPGLTPGFDVKNNDSMGSTIISLLVDQIDGLLECFNDQGASFTLFFPSTRE